MLFKAFALFLLPLRHMLRKRKARATEKDKNEDLHDVRDHNAGDYILESHFSRLCAPRIDSKQLEGYGMKMNVAQYRQRICK